LSDAAGGTALHIAAAKSFPPVVRALLAAGADRGVRNAAGRCPPPPPSLLLPLPVSLLYTHSLPRSNRLALDLASDRATAEAFRR